MSFPPNSPSGSQSTSSRILDRLQSDPIAFIKVLWPDVELYDKQREILLSVRDNHETFVPAGHMLGKDFVSGLVILWFFLTRHPVRIVTTSADYSQLESVLWGEVRRFIQTSRIPLESTKSGPLVVNHLHLRKMVPLRAQVGIKGPVGLPMGIDLDGMGGVEGGNDGEERGTRRDNRRGEGPPRMVVDGVSYCIGRVAARGEGMQGHHVTPESGSFRDDGIPRTLFLADEASGVDDLSYNAATTWAQRVLVVGNPYPGGPGCTFFKKAVTEGDLIAPEE